MSATLTFVSGLSILIAIAVTFVAALYDWRRGIIPNPLTYGGILFGLVLALLPGGVGWLECVVGLLIGGGFFLVFWLANAVGAGDVKLMAALGALLGWPLIWDVVFFTALFGGVFGILFLIWKRVPAVDDPNYDGDQPQKRYKQRMPYAVPVSLGTVTALVTQWL